MYRYPYPCILSTSYQTTTTIDIFEDQYRNLKQIAEDERSQGLPESMSRMVREAIDHYLTQRRK
jgi:hypothetical protein